MVDRIRKSEQFRSVYASGVWISGSPTEFRLLFMNNEPVEAEIEAGDSPMKNVREIPVYEVEVVMTRPLAEWIKRTLEAYLKESEAQTPERPHASETK